MEVYVLSAPHGKSPALREQKVDPTTLGQINGSSLGGTGRGLSGQNVEMSEVCELIERFRNDLVVDETHLKGSYSFHVKGDGHLESLLEEQLGLVMT